MFKIEKLSYSIPEKDLYHSISFEIEEGGHYALIGSNGSGKSTLVDMMLHSDSYLFEGKILYDGEMDLKHVGYVSQFTDHSEYGEQTVYDYISEYFRALDQEIEDLCNKMAEAADLEIIFEEYQKALDKKEAIDGDHFDVNIRKQLAIAGIEQLVDHKLVNLSGGEFKLVQVIREMLLAPKYMILDEPDVFLDFDHINSLVHLINTYQGTLLVVTHSRYLLNHCFDHIIHLEDCEIQVFAGNYSEYQLELLTTKVELQEIAAKEEEEILRQRAIVNKTRALATAIDSASLGKSVHARQTLLDRLENRRTKLPFVEIKQPGIHFPLMENQEEAEDEIILKLSDYSAEFNHELLDHIEIELKNRDKVAIIGKNGTGKSTILRDIYNCSPKQLYLDSKVSLQMFSQMIETSGQYGNKSLEELLREAGLETNSEITEYLERYGFSDREKSKSMNMLSGGEKDLMQLALIGLKPTNLLLLDEPTGHLDLHSQLALEQALKEYRGAILMVSHDFEIVANCMDYVLFVDDHEIRRMSIRKFRQMVYRDHFNKEDLLTEDRKKSLEVRIETLLADRDYEKAKEVLSQLEELLGSNKRETKKLFQNY